MLTNKNKLKRESIAIIGIAMRFPKSANSFEFWGNLINKVDCITEIPEERWDYKEIFSEDKTERNTIYSKWGGFIDDIDKFDSLFFKISPQEAKFMDPQEKLFLESAWCAFEDAGYGNQSNRKGNNIGVFAGVTFNEFAYYQHEEGYLSNKYAGPGCFYWNIPNRVSYFMGLNGPSMAIDTACSSSLVVIHEACKAIISGDCDMAIAGAVNLNLHPNKYLFFCQNNFLSSNGKSRGFSKETDGYVPGEGVASILLKPLDKAIADNDNIYGVIDGSAVNHDGSGKGYFVPNENAQTKLIEAAQQIAGVSPEQVSYIECHGSGTPIGDAVEIKSLKKVFEGVDKKQICALGTVKPNIGHLEAAAGISGLIKILLCMQYEKIPANLSTNNINPNIKINNSPFYLVEENIDWKSDKNKPLIAGVSSFGAGGTNSHLVLSSHKSNLKKKQYDDIFSWVVALSAKTEPQLFQYVENLLSYLKSVQKEPLLKKKYNLHNVAETLYYGREHYSHRVAFIAKDISDLILKLNQYVLKEENIKDVYQGVINDKTILAQPKSKDFVNIAKKRSYYANSWVNGSIDKQDRLDTKFNKIQLPTYPFKKEKSWITNQDTLYESTYRNKKKIEDDVAIIGMSGQYPMADNNDQFWDNLINGIDSITEIPIERWDYRKYYSPRKNTAGKTYSKWGGFINDYDKFDPLFFNISPLESTYLDPQERLFLKNTWSLLEDAGYTPETLVKGNSEDNLVGVFAGVMWNDYRLYSGLPGLKEFGMTNSSIWNIPNRVSYFFNFKGPSIGLDTACSSSLTAMHFACESIKKGECKMAIAGAVNLILHPHKYVNLAKMKLLSDNGRCRSFGDNATGYVPGEGVILFLLKSLKEAEKDGDNIYGVIKANAINHGGKMRSFNKPNSEAQSLLIKDLLRKADIDKTTITYFEAHGTGTTIGDPIEIESMHKAFGSSESPYCSLGSVKSNIGHLEAAAGMSGVAKVLLQMKHKQLVPTLHVEKPNPNIDFSSSPFYLQKKLAPWKTLFLKENNKMVPIPRRACVNSFGAGGSNAGLIIEEYQYNETTEVAMNTPYIFVFSAKTKESLNNYILCLVEFIEKDKKNINLANISYTLQVAKSEMKERLALVAENVQELIDKLNKHTNDEEAKNIFIANSVNKKDAMTLDYNDDINDLIAKKEYFKLAELWSEGVHIPWELLPQNKTARRIPLPTYQFLKNTYLLPINKILKNNYYSKSEHPFIDKNVSNFEEICFHKKFSTNDLFISDHLLFKTNCVPAVITLEMVRYVGGLAARNESTVDIIKNITWMKPMYVDAKDKEFKLSLNKKEDFVGYEIKDAEPNSKTIYSSGKFQYATDIKDEKKKPIDISEILERLTEDCSSEHLHYMYSKLGIEYGNSLSSFEFIKMNGYEMVTKLSIPKGLEAISQLVLHPSILDCSLQMIALFNIKHGSAYGDDKLYLPYYLKEIKIIEKVPKVCFAYARMLSFDENESRYNIFIYDENGNELVVMKEFTFRAVNLESQKAISINTTKEIDVKKEETLTPETLYFQSAWKEAPLEKTSPKVKIGKILLFDKSRDLYDLLKLKGEKPILVLPGKAYKQLDEDIFEISLSNEADYIKLCKYFLKYSPDNIKILYLWDQNIIKKNVFHKKDIDAVLEMGLFPVFYLTKALLKLVGLQDINLLYPYSNSSKLNAICNNSISGFIRSLKLEHPKFHYKLIQLSKIDNNNILKTIYNEFSSNVRDEFEIKYEKRIRKVKKNETFIIDTFKHSILDNKVYLITGGAGGLGLLFSKYLIDKYNAKICILGRSKLTKEKTQEIKKISNNITYFQADVTKLNQIRNVVKKVKEKFHKIDGVIHSAGVLNDCFVNTKNKTSFSTVLSPKIFGLVNLDKATKNEDLDFFVAFSSIVAVTGNVGQSDYAYANAFMDNYILFRESLVKKEERKGKSISINWPLWKEGGMKIAEVDGGGKGWVRSYLGMNSLEMEDGFKSFDYILSADVNHMIVVNGDKEKLSAFLLGVKKSQKDQIISNDINLQEKVENQILKIVSTELKIKESEIQRDVDLSEYGLNSIIIIRILQEIAEVYKNTVLPSAMIEYPTIKSFATYLIDEGIF
jgi:acyl transferase domain-containing protein